jgi:hypothetical protein
MQDRFKKVLDGGTLVSGVNGGSSAGTPPSTG